MFRPERSADIVSLSSEWILRIEQGRRTAAEASLGFAALHPHALAAMPFLPLIHRLLVEAGETTQAEIIAERIEIHPISALGHAAIDRAARCGTALAVEGWTANFGARNFHVVDQSLGSHLTPAEVIVRSRRDKQGFLIRAGSVLLPGDDRHGFTFVLPEAAPGAAGFYLVEPDAANSAARFYGPFRAPSHQNEALAAEIAVAPFGSAFATPLERAEALYRPLIARSRDPISTRRLEFGPPTRPTPPLYSVIIPFYGDAFFLSCVFHLQRLLDRRYEIIVVVDDPDLWPELFARIERRRSAIRIRTVLVRNAANYGFALANTLGAKEASGKALFFMNSDIFVENVDVLSRAGETIVSASASGREIIAGFLLQYEDEAIQHLGMEFVRLPWTNGLYIIDHPKKGLPLPAELEGVLHTAPAVTGALLGISSRLYHRLGGFDAAFVRGDFEDADLCLRARELGADIQVFAERGLYHLERQSFPHMGGVRLREIVTYLNCIEFNRRWSAQFDRVVVSKGARASPRRSRPFPALVAAQKSLG